ncbi:hypothetical protein Tco_0429216 [Tanacetum coccineum]
MRVSQESISSFQLECSPSGVEGKSDGFVYGSSGRVVPADYVSTGHVLVPAGSSSSVPADYVFAGHVLVPADRDRIC